MEKSRKKTDNNVKKDRDVRYNHDLLQAHAMRGNGAGKGFARQPSNRGNRLHVSSSLTLLAEDARLGMSGLKEAKALHESGDWEEAMILYEKSLEVLIRFLRDSETASVGVDRKQVDSEVRSAFVQAESIKAQLKQSSSKGGGDGGSQKSSESPKEGRSKGHFHELVNALVLSLSRPITPPSAAATSPASTHARSTTNTFQNTRTSTAAAAAGQTRNGSNNTDTAQSALRQVVYTDLYVNPAELQKTTWDDIAGLAEVKQSLQETAILPLIRPDLFQGLRRPQNVLLYGPPGTGKTMLVRAVASASKSNLFMVTASTLTSKWMGEAEKLVRTLFQIASEMAPSIVFVDEIDSLLSKRKSEGEHEASRRLKTEFMVSMDGLNSGSGANEKNTNVIVLGCTNCPWDLDNAILRRFPRRIYTPLPDKEARRALLNHLLDKAGRHSLTSRQVSNLASITEGFSCSDLTAIASDASFGPLRSLGGMDAISTVQAQDIRPLAMSDFETALRQATKSVSETQIQLYRDWQRQQAASG